MAVLFLVVVIPKKEDKEEVTNYTVKSNAYRYFFY
jgi:hypothetical protein